MSETNEIKAAAPSAAPNADPATLVAQIRAIRSVIPDYTQLATPAKRSLLPIASGTDPEFVQAAINSVGASDNVQQCLGRTPDDLRQETVDAQSWTAVEDEARALFKGIAAANLVRRHRIGTTALAVYAIARRLAKQPEHADLLPHVKTMKRLNRFGVRKRKPAEQAPTSADPGPVAKAA